MVYLNNKLLENLKEDFKNESNNITWLNEKENKTKDDFLEK